MHIDTNKEIIESLLTQNNPTQHHNTGVMVTKEQEEQGMEEYEGELFNLSWAMRLIQNFLDSAYELGINPLPGLRKKFPFLSWKMKDCIDKSSLEKIYWESDYIWSVPCAGYVAAQVISRKERLMIKYCRTETHFESHWTKKTKNVFLLSANKRSDYDDTFFSNMGGVFREVDWSEIVQILKNRGFTNL